MKTQVQNKINELKAQIAELPCTMEESIEADNIYTQMVISLTDKAELLNSTEFKKAYETSEKARLTTELRMYERTMEADLTKIATRYIITDSNLISPSGFHASDLVFITNKVMIQTNRLPRNLSRNLKAYDTQQLKVA